MHRLMRVAFTIPFIVLLCSCDDDSQTAAYYDDCGDSAGQSEECFVTRREPESAEVALAQEIADRWIDEHAAAHLPWDWGEGVLMFALTELYRITDEAQYRDYTASWLDLKILEGYDIYWSDSCPPALTAIALAGDRSDSTYEQVVLDVLHYLAEEAPRSEEGGIGHLGDFLGLEPTLWADSLFMFGMVQTRWGEWSADQALLDDFVEQFLIFSSLMQHENGLFLHAYNWPAATETDIYWARGNGWVIAAGFDHLRVRQLRGELESQSDLVESLERHASALIQAQDEASGMWWNILNRPDEIYLETSATALIAYGLARGYRYGILGEEVLPVLNDALTGIREQIRRDEEGRPIVTGISGPTTAGNYDDYAEVELEEDLSFGVGAVILALTELSGLPLDQ